MKHLNNNILAAVDVETTGDRPGFHDIIQIAIVPLDENLEPSKRNRHFEIKMKPKRPENVDYHASEVHKLDMLELMNRGIDPDDAIIYFSEWFGRLDLPIKGKLIPVASNWIFDQGFVCEWLGHTMFNERFHFHYRDTQAVALYLNDRAAELGERYPFTAVGLPDLANHYGIENLKAHDALQDCITTGAVYKKQCWQYTPVTQRDQRTLKEPTNKWFEMNKFSKKDGVWSRELPDGKGIVRMAEKWYICSETAFIDLPETLAPDDILRFWPV